MADFYQGRAWIELDRAALRHNVARLQGILPPGCVLMPAVKADAYGHGAVLVARELNTLGIQAFCVATVLEGVDLRQHGISGEILVLGYTHPQYAPLLKHYHLTQTVLDHAYALELNACCQEIQVHVKIDTGMHRLGERFEELEKLQQIFDCRYLHVTGTYTHLYADGLALPAGRRAALAQKGAFDETVNHLKELGCRVPRAHILASGGLLHCPDFGGDYARVGIALYGQMDTTEEWKQAGIDLRPVLSLKARIGQVKRVFRGEGAGYGYQFQAGRDSQIAVTAIGYGDGLPRGLSDGRGVALVCGQEAPVVGRVCMDQTLLDVTDIPGAAPGETAVFIGRSGGRKITACDIAAQVGTISNEILGRLGARLERCWLDGETQ